MGLFKKSEGGFMDVIRCDQQDFLVWKWTPDPNKHGKSNKENAIRWGSSLRVKEGEVAVLLYRQQTGTMQDFIVGPYDDILKTDNLPVLTGILGAAYDGNSPFQAEVYYINMAGVIQIPFTIPYFSVFDPRYHDFSCPVSARGKITFSITDYKQFIKLHRLTEFSLEQFSNQVGAGIKKYAKSFIGNAPGKYGFPVVQLERFIAELSDAMKIKLAPEMLEDFGVTLTRVDLYSIDCDKESEEYKKLFDQMNVYYQDSEPCLNEMYTKIDIKDASKIIDLNGKTITGRSTNSSASKLITVSEGATLKLTGEGTIDFTAGKPDTNWGGEGQLPFPGYSSNTISNNGKLIIDGPTLINNTARGGASYVIDNYQGSELIVKSGKIHQTGGDQALRIFANSNTLTTSLTIEGGEIIGRRALWIQLPNSNPDRAPKVNKLGSKEWSEAKAKVKIKIYGGAKIYGSYSRS